MNGSKVLLNLAGLLLVLGISSASALDSFGTISGEASVEPALGISEIDYQGFDEAVEIYNPSDRSINLTSYELFDRSLESKNQIRELEAINSSELDPESFAIIVEGGYEPKYVGEVNYYNASTLSLTDDGEIVGIQTEDGEVVIDEIEYTSECSDSDDTYHRKSLTGERLECDSKNFGNSTYLSDSQ